METSNFKNRIGMKFGKLKVVEYLGDNKWRCECECGNEKIVSSGKLPLHPVKRLPVKSCGCLLHSRLTTNYNFFEKIDTEEKAYIVGFLAADGCITSDDAKSSYQIKIVVQRRDRDILEKIKKAFDTKATIKDYSSTSKLPQGGECNYHASSLLISGKELVKDLIKIGVTPKKSLTLSINYNMIPEELKRHFWRGLLEGDGSFGVYGKKQILSLCITTSIFMAESTKEELLKIFPKMKISYYHAIGCSENTVRFIITTQSDVMTFLNFVYEDSTIFLNRKFEDYLKIKENN